MLRILIFHPSEKHILTFSLIKFFNEVDVNGDGDLTWQEFSNYIIELGKIVLFIRSCV
jgi:Ca2+-binding EF-hand superfamily protein